MMILWAISTRVDTRGRATANTERQLRTILWPELAKWHRLFIGRELFTYTSTSLHSADPLHEKTWRVDAIPWSEDNPEAFAGLHNYGKRVIVIFDEASAIHDKIWETIDGVMHEAETELIWIATGNTEIRAGRGNTAIQVRRDNARVGYSQRTDSAFGRFVEVVQPAGRR